MITFDAFRLVSLCIILLSSGFTIGSLTAAFIFLKIFRETFGYCRK